MIAALDEGSSLILFPEGTRNLTEMPLLPFKSGLYRLALARPGVEMVPVWIANLNRAMPKGELIPVPILCTVSFGMPVRLREGEEKTAFLERARASLLSLRPREHSRP
jgi:1-acyl-sn-glycerol-3-phosphate acyltransferase